MKAIVFGASGMVGSVIASRLSQSGDAVVGASRFRREATDFPWLNADLARPQTIQLPLADVVFCAADARLFAKAMDPVLAANPSRIVVITSTSVFSKVDSKDADERASIAELIDGERSIIARCEAAAVGWTILRPTLIYQEGRDNNVTQIARLIRKIGFMPLYGSATGLRQPVHAEDLAIGAIAAAKSPRTANVAYATSGLETITYREMTARVFDGLARKRRLVSLPPIVWKLAFSAIRPFYPDVTTAMGERMLKDLAFDSSAANLDFGWKCRAFNPQFK